jgi:hypothetical protein
MTTAISHEAISDWSGCPDCVAKGEAGYATAYFNADGALWGVCGTHSACWYVTRELAVGSIEQARAALD